MKIMPKLIMLFLTYEDYVCVFGIYGLSTLVSYLISNLFYTNKQFYLKQFSLA